MATRCIDGRQYALQPDGSWAPTDYQRLLDQDAAQRQAHRAERQRIEREAVRANAYQPRPCGADFATGLVLGALLF